MVAPFAGVWIEILCTNLFDCISKVAPFAGVWIEIIIFILYLRKTIRVAPFAGVWIEIMTCQVEKTVSLVCRTLRGCVD